VVREGALDKEKEQLGEATRSTRSRRPMVPSMGASVSNKEGYRGGEQHHQVSLLFPTMLHLEEQPLLLILAA
jgi:hypothetical protein